MMFIMAILLSGCGTNFFDRPDAEGVIIYDVTFPFIEGSILENVFPEEMTLWFKDDLVCGQVRSLGGIMKTNFVADNHRKVITQSVKNYSKYVACTFNENGVKQFLADQPNVRLESTGDSADVAGYRCAVTIAHFLIDSVPPIELYHTNEIDIRRPNWYTQFAEINEVLLGYEIEQFGMRMRLRARQVMKKDIDDAKFEIPEKYTYVSIDEFKATMRTILDDFLGD